MERTYAEYAAHQAVELLAIDSPTGFTRQAAEWVLNAFRSLGYEARTTVKCGVLIGRECRRVVVSVFVNPTQFNDPADLRSYPRNLEADLKLLEAAGADFVYAPSVEDVYPEPDTRQFDFGQTDKVMEARTVRAISTVWRRW